MDYGIGLPSPGSQRRRAAEEAAALQRRSAAHQAPQLPVPRMSLSVDALVAAQARGVPASPAPAGAEEAAVWRLWGDVNFRDCLRRYARLVDGAGAEPARCLEWPGAPLLRVNAAFLAVFVAAWEEEFPVDLTLCANVDGTGLRTATLAVGPPVMHEILLRSAGPASVERQERLPVGFCLCTTADSRLEQRAPVSLTVDAWLRICALWPEQFPEAQGRTGSVRRRQGAAAMPGLCVR
eukprot:Rhum_TRINITY_DN12299_c0_g2::Rhum_TRINITY_DN12299_c0_g2_i1::g.50775::m.50775